jgi:hypothetical protein
LRHRFTKAKAVLAENKLKLKTGELHDNASCVRRVYQAEMRCKRELMSLGRGLSTSLVGKSVEEVRSIIDWKVTSIVDQLSRDYKTIRGESV